MDAMKRDVRYAKLASVTTGTYLVEMRKNNSGTSGAAMVFSHATPELHSTVTGACHQNDFIRSTGGIEDLPLAILS